MHTHADTQARLPGVCDRKELSRLQKSPKLTNTSLIHTRALMRSALPLWLWGSGEIDHIILKVVAFKFHSASYLSPRQIMEIYTFFHMFAQGSKYVFSCANIATNSGNEASSTDLSDYE